MPATKCNACGQAHPKSYRIRHDGPKCVYHDPNNKVDPRLVDHRGLPDDCPGCLGHGTIIKRSYGRRGGDYALECTDCRTVYHWSDR